MLNKNFMSVYMPYCLEKRADGTYVVLNRKYKPIGIETTEKVKYEDHPAVKRISPSTAKKLSHSGSNELDKIYLYDDRTNPTNAKEDMEAYLKRVGMLAMRKVFI